MDRIKSAEDLEVFKKAHGLTLKLYRVSKKFPEEERFNLTSQLRRAAVSIGANLMEGGHRLNRKEFRQFAGISKGSVGELKYYLLLSRDLEYISQAEYPILRAEADEISKMLNGLIRSLSGTK